MWALSTFLQGVLQGAAVTARWIVRVQLPSSQWFGASNWNDEFVWNNGTTGDITYLPLAETMQVTIPPVQASNKGANASVQLSAVNPAVLTGLMGEAYRAAPVDIALLFFQAGVPQEERLKFRGLGNAVSIDRTPQKAPKSGSSDDAQPVVSTLTFTVAPKTVDFKRTIGRYATDIDQRTYRDPTDNFFQDVALVGMSQINWGVAGPASPAASASNAAPAGAPNGVQAPISSLIIPQISGLNQI